MKNTIFLIKLFIFFDCFNDSASSLLLISIFDIFSFFIMCFHLINVDLSILFIIGLIFDL